MEVSLDKLRQQQVYILGLGRTGLSVIPFLQSLGCTVHAWDTSAEQRARLPQGVPAVDPETVTDWSVYAGVLKSPGVAESVPVVQALIAAGVPILSDIDLLSLRAPDARYIAITGTNGKSTTTALIGHLLREAGYKVEVGGNIGRPALDMPILGADGFYVLELSSYQLLHVNQMHPHVAVLLNLSPDHLERHGNMENYLAAKARIFELQQPGDVRVVGVDNYELEQFTIGLGYQVTLRRVSVTGVGADVVATDDGRLLDRESPRGPAIVDLRTIEQLPGRHNWQNIACAWAAVKDFMTPAQFVSGLHSFAGLKHRLQRVLVAEGIVYVNDSKATNADAANRALESLQNIYWIAGGRPKSDGIEPCLEYLAQVKGAYLIGEAAQDFAQVLEGKVPHVEICGTLDKAVQAAHNAARQAVQATGTVAHVVLAPACASWDQFDSFEHRGNAFVQLAYQVAGVTPPPEEEEEE